MLRYIFILLVFVCSMTSHAQDTSKAYRNTVAGSYNFWFYRPDEDEGDGVHRPLLIFLHGASLCGTDLNKVKKYGPMEALKRGRAIDCYVLAPQNPGGAWKPEKIMKLIEWAEANFHIDSDRIYCYGMSLGGYGTLDMCATYPDRIAAGMAMCGGATVKDLSGLSRIPMSILLCPCQHPTVWLRPSRRLVMSHVSSTPVCLASIMDVWHASSIAIRPTIGCSPILSRMRIVPSTVISKSHLSFSRTLITTWDAMQTLPPTTNQPMRWAIVNCQLSTVNRQLT